MNIIEIVSLMFLSDYSVIKWLNSSLFTTNFFDDNNYKLFDNDYLLFILFIFDVLIVIIRGWTICIKIKWTEVLQFIKTPVKLSQIFRCLIIDIIYFIVFSLDNFLGMHISLVWGINFSEKELIYLLVHIFFWNMPHLLSV